MGSDDVEVTEQADGSKSWVRFADDEDVRRVIVSFQPDSDWPWEIYLPIAEFVRENPLETVFRARVDGAIRVQGISEVAEEDRELWLARGAADGAVIARSVGDALDAISAELEAALELD